MNVFLLSCVTGFVASIAPGPSFLYVFNLSILVENIYAPLCGMWFGSFICGVLALAGVSALLIKIPVTLLFLKFIGSIILIYLGLQKFFVRKNTVLNKDKKKSQKSFWQGTIITFSNPKIFLYYTVIIPQFIVGKERIFIQFTRLVFAQLILKAFALVVWFFICRFLSKKIINKNIIFVLNKFLGIAFLSIGLIMICLVISGNKLL